MDGFDLTYPVHRVSRICRCASKLRDEYMLVSYDGKEEYQQLDA